MSLESKQGQF